MRKSIESMTGLHVNQVDLHVVGVSFEKENQEMQQSQKLALSIEEEKEQAIAEEAASLEQENTEVILDEDDPLEEDDADGQQDAPEDGDEKLEEPSSEE